MHSHGQVFKLWKILKQANLKLSPPNKPRSLKSTLKTPSKQAINIKHGTYLLEEAPRNYPWEPTENEPGSYL